MDKNIRIALVEYLNTLPFQWALEEIKEKLSITVLMVPPAKCAELLKNGEVDLSLVPLGALEDFDEIQRVTDYGIACDGPVRTVCIFSNVPVQEVTHLYLDNHSRTSQKLAQILMRYYWKNDASYEIVEIKENLKLGSKEAVLMIGDKVFENEGKFKYVYDLGSIWKEKTGLPFVFAAWMYLKSNPLEDSVIQLFNDYFKKEMDGLESNLELKLENKGFNPGLVKYFQKNISYHLGKSKKMGMQLFLEKVAKLRSNKGMATVEKETV